MLDIRSVTPSELVECALILSNSDPWHLLNWSFDKCLLELQKPRLEVVGIFTDSGLVGFLAMLSEGIEFDPVIVYLCISEQSRNLGIGTQLVNHFEESYPESANLYLFVSDINPNAQRLYERLGYVKVGEIPDFNYVGQTEFFYRKTRRPLNGG